MRVLDAVGTRKDARQYPDRILKSRSNVTVLLTDLGLLGCHDLCKLAFDDDAFLAIRHGLDSISVNPMLDRQHANRLGSAKGHRPKVPRNEVHVLFDLEIAI
jgi:hypothetical protein